ncbi:Lpp/OprI family alanine-zipper lipoprotein [Vibrio sp. CAU 1672]|uniref:Lpp/OprI family alanine-zipper lipoprotein n=1 Tax=Vibrio sp. CAU 1672 TaxID=3032594 RepID=UPI0023DA7A05|nr:Lpp/OprI family alanine-zipper lipoprotein [Vibrio sp. CAU 1672]MDF2152673.1 Lpp/OprI family alanine-zipper lipoprotein [Vibrio sp. CAU 1672]
MNKTLIAAAATSVLLLAGCASSDEAVTANAAKLDELSNQISQLSQDVQMLKSDVQKSGDAAMAAQEEAARANERIDNIAQSYTK